MVRFKLGNQVQAKYRPYELGTVFKIKEGAALKRTLYYIRMKNKSIQITTGESFVKINKSNH